jgi:uncharacterized protein with HEPN domain
MACWRIYLSNSSKPIGNGSGFVERGIEIISEASRHLTDEMKARHPEIPWQKVAAIGNVLRHNYEKIAAPVIWKLAQTDLPALEKVCRVELDVEGRPGRSS